MHTKRDDANLIILISIIILGTALIYQNRNVSLLEFRLLFFCFFLPIFVESFLFRKGWHTNSIQFLLFFHVSGFIIATTGLYIDENEQLFFGLFFAGFLIIVLSYVLLENLGFTTLIMKLFTGSIAFWIVFSYFPLNKVISIIFGAVAFFLSYIFFEIPTRDSGQVTRPPASDREQEQPSSGPPPVKKMVLKREVAQLMTELDHVILELAHAQFPQYPEYEEKVKRIQAVYQEREDSFKKYTPAPSLENLHSKFHRCQRLLLKMQQAQKSWLSIEQELGHLSDHLTQATLPQVNEIRRQGTAFWSQFHHLTPRSYWVTFERRLNIIEDTVLKYEKIKKEWHNLVTKVDELMDRIPTLERAEHERVMAAFYTNLHLYQQCIPEEKLQDVHRRILYCRSRITIAEQWNSLAKTIRHAAKNPHTLSKEAIEKLEREFLSRINEFASVVSAEEISWMKVQFKQCYSKLNNSS